MPKGKVKWFNQTKGYGFIAPEEGDKDVFVHITAVRDSGMQNLEEDQEVEFEIVEKDGKSSAENLKLRELRMEKCTLDITKLSVPK